MCVCRNFIELYTERVNSTINEELNLKVGEERGALTKKNTLYRI